MSLRLEGIGALYTMEARGADRLGIVEDATLVCEGSRVRYAGPAREAPPLLPSETCVDVGGRAVLPGLVDPHTHLLFAGSRRDEFALRARGASYAEIMAAGGGIRSTMRAVRGASEDELARLALPRLEAMLWRGVTTIEAKSGYGLSFEDELKCLRVLRRLHQVHDIDIVPTFLGAHAVPPEFEGRGDDYVSLLTDELLPAVREADLAAFCDVFIERGAFDIAQAERILSRAADLGLGLRVHAEQLSWSGGARLAAELRAAAVGHLEFATADDARALSEAGVVCEVLATAQVFLGMRERVPGRMLADAGCRMAVGTDYNPGSAHCADLHLAGGLAVTMAGLSAEEALLGMTRVAAASLGRSDRGRLSPGTLADLVVLEGTSALELLYHWGHNPVASVVKAGRLLDIGSEVGAQVG